MTEKYKLTTTLSTLFVYVINIIGIGFISFLIYSIITWDVIAIFIFSIFILLLYLKFYRSFIRFKDVNFDSEFIYIDDEIISFKDVTEIKRGKITYLKNGIKNNVYYNYFYGINYKQLNDFHSEKTK
jgi:uncharacterized membrane protein